MNAKARAEELVNQTYCKHQNSNDRELYRKLMVKALESFAAEAVKEALGLIGDTCSKHNEQARNEALEEAADKIKVWEIASEIVLSLKSKPERDALRLRVEKLKKEMKTIADLHGTGHYVEGEPGHERHGCVASEIAEAALNEVAGSTDPLEGK